MRNNIRILTILGIICALSIGIVSAVGNSAAEGTVTVKPTETVVKSIETVAKPVDTVTKPEETVSKPTIKETEQKKEGKFRVGPTVKIRPLNDIINKSSDGLVELYLDNPSVNDVSLSVDARISVPSGIHVFGQGFGEAGAAGTVYGTFDVPPGKARTIYITIKAEKTGDFTAQFSGMYWPGDKKDDFQPISLTHPFKVYEASSDPTKEGKIGGQDSGKGGAKPSPGLSTSIVMLVIVLAFVLMGRRHR